jgi:uncharacterized protein (DUF983 family)
VNPNTEIALAILAGFATLAIGVVGTVLVMGVEWASRRRSAQAVAGEAARSDNPSGRDLIWRALCRRCPSCGRGSVLKSYFGMNERCPVCGAVFWRNDGEQVGPMVVDCSVATAAGFAAWAMLVFLGCSEAMQLALAVAAVVGSVVLLAPWSRSFWTLFLYVSGGMEPGNPQTGGRQ